MEELGNIVALIVFTFTKSRQAATCSEGGEKKLRSSGDIPYAASHQLTIVRHMSPTNRISRSEGGGGMDVGPVQSSTQKVECKPLPGAARNLVERYLNGTSKFDERCAWCAFAFSGEGEANKEKTTWHTEYRDQRDLEARDRGHVVHLQG